MILDSLFHSLKQSIGDPAKKKCSQNAERQTLQINDEVQTGWRITKEWMLKRQLDN
jgi:hypothetical protein